MKFQTKRCKYEDLRYTDIDEAVKLFTNEKVRKFLGGPISEEAARAKLNSVIGSKDICYCAVRLIETNELIGLIIFTTAHNEERTEELSYMFLPEYWGKDTHMKHYTFSLTTPLTFWICTCCSQKRKARTYDHASFWKSLSLFMIIL